MCESASDLRNETRPPGLVFHRSTSTSIGPPQPRRLFSLTAAVLGAQGVDAQLPPGPFSVDELYTAMDADADGVVDREEYLMNARRRLDDSHAMDKAELLSNRARPCRRKRARQAERLAETR